MHKFNGFRGKCYRNTSYDHPVPEFAPSLYYPIGNTLADEVCPSGNCPADSIANLSPGGIYGAVVNGKIEPQADIGVSYRPIRRLLRAAFGRRGSRCP